MHRRRRLPKREIMELRAALGQQLATCRKSRKMTQEDVAVRLNMTRTSITMIELGRQAVTCDQLWDFADLYETRIELLLCPGSVLWARAR